MRGRIVSKIKRIHLFSRLSKTAYSALESATTLAKTRGNAYVELSHWINQIFMSENTDLHAIIKHFNLNEEAISKDLISCLDKLPRGSSSIEDFSNLIEVAIKEAWMITSIVFSKDKIRTGALIVAIKQTPELSSKLNDISREFIKINGEVLQENFNEILKGSVEEGEGYCTSPSSTGQAKELLGQNNSADPLSLYTVDLTQKAKNKEIDEIVGRDKEIRKAIDVLLRRKQNNPIFTGEAGVGKTAIAEGLAVKIANGNVPDGLKGALLKSLDIGLLQAGASMRGEFEDRLKKVIEAVQSSPTPIILFIDEAHTLIGAGGSAGQNDAANLLKPALARGQLRCIAATTWAEYIKYFEKDPALSRRFQNILIDEPDDERCIHMMRKMAVSLEKYHQVAILDEAIVASVKLSRRYLPARKLPDKSTSVLDTACAKVALSQSAVPENLEFITNKIASYELEKEILQRESKEGLNHEEELSKINEKISDLCVKKGNLEDKFKQEQEIANKYKDLRAKLNGANKDELIRLKEQISDILVQLSKVQGEEPMVLPVVDAQAVSVVISEWTGIPLARMQKSEAKDILSLDKELAKNVIGQDHSLKMLTKRIITARANLADPQKPQAVFMLAGPSGVGKTQTALAIAELVYGSENNIITINMSEFQEAHTVSTLKGAPPGYVGYGEGGVLTEAVRKKPYSVVLLDEIEKAHPDVHEIFFQVFDKGRMEDGAGRLVDFRNTIIILTTNVGESKILDMCEDENSLPTPEILEKAIRPAMQKVFPMALLGRLVVVPYYPLHKTALHSIIDLKLNKIVKRVNEIYKATLSYDVKVKDEIIARCDNIASGARMIDSIINNELLPEISMEFLQRSIDSKAVDKVVISADDGKFSYNFSLKD